MKDFERDHGPGPRNSIPGTPAEGHESVRVQPIREFRPPYLIWFATSNAASQENIFSSMPH